MTHGRPPRKPRWQRTPDTLLLAKSGAAKPVPADLQAIIDSLILCFEALRKGTVNEDQFSVLSGAVYTARAIEDQRVVKGLSQVIEQGEQALNQVWQRITASGVFGRTALYPAELVDIREFVSQHIFQIRQLSRAEYLRAMRTATGRMGPKGLVLKSTKEMREFVS